jgi:uncharacterized membrane protein
MKRLSKPFIVAISATFICAVVLSGCYYDKEELLYHNTGATDCATISAKFSTDVAPLMANKCATAGCHDAASGAGGSVLETYGQISATAAKINQRCVVEKNMPPGSALSAAEIASLSCWINSGSPNN